MGYSCQIVISILALLFGAKGFTLRPLFHPLTYNFDEKTVHLFRDGSHFVGNGKTFWDQTKYIPFMPAVLVNIIVLLAGNGKSSGVAFTILMFVLGLVAIVGVVRYFNERSKERELNTIPWFYDQEETGILLRTGENKSLTINQLPSRHKTLGIRFQAFKAQVCRPFSQ